MRAGCLTYERFCAEAELLQKRSHELASGQEVREEATWEWRHGNRQHLDGDSYLVSVGNARRYQMKAADATAKPRNDDGLTGDINELLLAEEEAWTGEEETQTTLAPSQDAQTALLEFHIVYHTIYQTPVLYFRAFAVDDGRPLPSGAVTRDVQLPGSNGRSTFVAMEEHPVLGTPFSFLHPCETAEAMQLLQAQSRPDANATSEEKVPWYLASWLSLVQPLTGISPLGYNLAKQTRTGNMNENATRLRKKQRVEAVPLPAAANSRAKFAFGSRLPDAGQSLLKGPKRSGSARFHAPTRMRYGYDAQAPANPRKRRSSVSRDEKMSSDKPSHRALTVKTALSLQGSHLPARTKVPALLSGAHLHTISPSNPALRHRKRRSAEESELVADLDATEPAFWIKRRERVEAALKDLDAIEESFMAISK